ncbi:MAG TPA: DedA family protein [Tepidisphaeraceae bacterium]|nr:DedA family protein [Tepidisphaeraceae bacterium]
MFILARLSIDEHVRHWVRHGGPPVLFLLLFSCGLGMPLPEDIPLLAAGGMIAAGQMNLALAAICGWAGIIGGDCVLYYIGKSFGSEVSRIPFIGRHVSEQRMRHVEKLFERWGIWVVAVGRMFAGIRGAMVVVAGATRFTFWKFILADSLAAVVSGGLFLYLGFVFSKKVRELNQHVHQAKRWILIGCILLVIAVVLFVWIKNVMKKKHSVGLPVLEANASPPTVDPVPQSPAAASTSTQK